MEIRVGKITHYYNRISVAVAELNDGLKVGDKIAILGHTTEFTQTVQSMEIDHKQIDSAGGGQEIALKVWDTVRRGDLIYKVID